MSDILTMLLIGVESDKIPLLHKLKQLYKRLPVGFLIDIADTAHNVLYKYIFSIRNCDHVMKTLHTQFPSLLCGRGSGL